MSLTISILPWKSTDYILPWKSTSFPRGSKRMQLACYSVLLAPSTGIKNYSFKKCWSSFSESLLWTVSFSHFFGGWEGVCWDPHLVVLRGIFWLCSQKLLLVLLVPGCVLGAICDASKQGLAAFLSRSCGTFPKWSSWRVLFSIFQLFLLCHVSDHIEQNTPTIVS